MVDGYSDEEILAAGGVSPTVPTPTAPPPAPLGPPPLPTRLPPPPQRARQAYRPAEPGWWIASDGFWYPPESRVPAPPLPPPPGWAPVTPPHVVVNVLAAPYGYQGPPTPMAYGPAKSKVAAGLLGIFLGALGIHRFYLGYTGVGVTMVLLTVLSLGLLSPITALWGFIEGIVILSGGMPDSRRQPLV